MSKLSAAALAAALDSLQLVSTVTSPLGNYADTITASITDSVGQSAMLTSTANLAIIPRPTNMLTTLQITSAAETSDNPAQTITGLAYTLTVPIGDSGQPSVGGVLAGAVITVLDNGTAIGAATTNSNGDFSADVTLPFIGANVLTLSTPLPASTATNTVFPATVVGVTDTLLPPPVEVGSGPDTLSLSVSERAEPGTEFTVSVDGQQVGGVQTTSADVLAGYQQTFNLEGYFPAGGGSVSIDDLNADNSLLLINSATIDGAAVAGAAMVLSNDGTAGFDFNAPGSPSTTTIGEGADSLDLFVSERGQPAGAQFTIDVDGAQVGGVQTVTADATAGQEQGFDVLGDFASGTNTVTVNYLNADQSLLEVDSAYQGGTSLLGQGGLVLSNVGSESFGFTGPDADVPLSITRVGSGPDTLALDLSQRAEPAGAEFTVSVDGQQYGGVQTVTADTLAGQVQELDVLGDFAPGPAHDVSLTYLNADNSLLLVDNATINGTTVAAPGPVLSNGGSLGLQFVTPPPAFAFATFGSGPDTLTLNFSEDYFQGNAQFTIFIDGQQYGGTQTANGQEIGGVQTVSAIHGNGQSQQFNFLGNFAGADSAQINFLNPASVDGGTAGLARNLYLDSGSIDGNPLGGTGVSISGTQSLYFGVRG